VSCISTGKAAYCVTTSLAGRDRLGAERGIHMRTLVTIALAYATFLLAVYVVSNA